MTTVREGGKRGNNGEICERRRDLLHLQSWETIVECGKSTAHTDAQLKEGGDGGHTKDLLPPKLI